MGKNRVFFPQTALDAWIVQGRVDLTGDELTLKAEARRYRILEAARVVSEVTGVVDGNELLGKVKTRAHLAELGAELLETSMVLGDNAYEVVPGFLATPSFAPFEQGASGPPASDEEVLAGYLLASS